MADDKPKKSTLRSFPRMYWIVVMFEFFERGAYYGVMSVLSVYLTDILGFDKESVGTIKGTIQPLLYFLPIIAGALADRFGYRRTLLVAFALLGGGYFLTSQMTTYTAVFMSLVVMGLGAGAFKPIINSTIARITDESNSALGFGIYYWSINLGAFLFPFILVPLLKNNIGWEWVLIASAICTGIMIIPTLTMFRDPPIPAQKAAGKKPSLLRTVANAFEIIYSPVILIYSGCRRKKGLAFFAVMIFLAFTALAVYQYLAPRTSVVSAPGTSFKADGVPLEVRVERNMTAAQPYEIRPATHTQPMVLVIRRPDDLGTFLDPMMRSLHEAGLPATINKLIVSSWIQKSVRPPQVRIVETGGQAQYSIVKSQDVACEVHISDPSAYQGFRDNIISDVRVVPELATISGDVIDGVVKKAMNRPFFLLFIALMILSAVIILVLESQYKRASSPGRVLYIIGALAAGMLVLWLLPELSAFARILTSVIFLTVLSLYPMDFSETGRFGNHWRFLLLIFLYSGFWVLYFQMFDSVLWYVKAYVDATPLNSFVNNTLAAIGIHINWFFDVEHVTVINAGVIIMLMLLISRMVARTKALPTMMVGIAMATIGMAILAINTNIWVFMLGITIFSIGEMTTHPKFISYVGLTAPKDRVGTYMGYIFLYGVIGASIGAPLGAKLYVHYVDTLNQPRALWLIFSLIGVYTIVALLLYNRFLTPKEESPSVDKS